MGAGPATPHHNDGSLPLAQLELPIPWASPQGANSIHTWWLAIQDSKLEIVIPEYLVSLKSKLDRLAYKVRKHATDNGKKVATSLRLDDQTESLTVAVGQGKESQWL